LPEDGFHFVQKQSFNRRLNDLEWLRQEIRVWHSVRQTSQIRADDTRLRVAPENFRALRRQWFLAAFKVRENVAKIFRIRRLAQTEQSAQSSRFRFDLPDS